MCRRNQHRPSRSKKHEYSVEGVHKHENPIPMLQIRKINSCSNRACRSLFQLFQPLSHETLDFHFVKNVQHTLLSKPRAVTPLLSIHKNYAKQLCAIPTREYTFLSYCRSRPRGVAKHRDRVLTLGAVHFFLCLAPSVRVTFLVFATPLVRECLFCVCLMQMCCWRSGFSLPACIRNSLNTCLQIRMVNHVRF